MNGMNTLYRPGAGHYIFNFRGFPPDTLGAKVPDRPTPVYLCNPESAFVSNNCFIALFVFHDPTYFQFRRPSSLAISKIRCSKPFSLRVGISFIKFIPVVYNIYWFLHDASPQDVGSTFEVLGEDRQWRYRLYRSAEPIP